VHELTITQNIVAIATEYSQGAKIYKISLEIGKLSAVMPEAIEFCFDVCCRGTPLENADLEIVEIAGKGRKRSNSWFYTRSNRRFFIDASAI
jgi:hydrogenase nickel incorporation protein HypA/HybF